MQIFRLNTASHFKEGVLLEQGVVTVYVHVGDFGIFGVSFCDGRGS